MNDIGEKIKALRKKKGFSQEELAEAAKINLRTIQRIENNKNEPRGQTLNLICNVLDINVEDILDYGKQRNVNYLVFFHLSVIVFLVIPLGNIILPLILWITKKEKIISLKEVGVNLLNFQIIWTFVTYIFLLIFVLLKITHFEVRIINPYSFIYIWIVLYVVNIILPILFAVKTSKGVVKNFYPNLIRLIK